MGKRYIAIGFVAIVIVGLLFAAIPGIEAAGEDSVSDILRTLPLKSISYNYDDGGTKSAAFYFSPGLLLQDARTVGNTPTMGEISKASVALAMAAYSPSYINNMLRAMGFTLYDNSAVYNRSQNELTFEDNDYIAYTIAYQDVPNPMDGKTYRIYCVPIQGTPQNAEWFSDFHLGTDVEHEGFRKASLEVYNQLRDYFAQDGMTADTRIVWLTGHSRGAACSNMIAGWLSRRAEGYTMAEHVFGYTYACPAVSLRADTTLTNIYNFNNIGDMVTMLPMSQWGYRRNGQDIILDTSELQLNNFRQQFTTTTGTTYAGEITDVNYEKLLTQIVGTDLDAFNSSVKLQMVLDIAAWAFGGRSDAKISEVLGRHLTFKNHVINKLQKFTGKINDAYTLLTQTYDENDGLSVWAYQAYNDTLEMKQEQFQAYVKENSAKVSELKTAAEMDIVDAQSFLAASNELQTASNSIRSAAEAVLAAMELLTDENGNVLDKILHGHSKATYILWVNSMYFGHRGWYNNDELLTADARSVCLSVGEYAFYGCDSLSELSLPNTIGYYAAGSCSGLRTVTIPVDYDFATDPFKDTRGVKTIHYTYGQTGVMLNRDGHSVNYHYIDYQYTLEYHSRNTLETMNFAEGITHIGNKLFDAGSSSLKTVHLPSTLQTIGSHAFYNCGALTGINLGDALTTIGSYAFYNCTSLTSTVSFSEGLQTIGSYAFAGCQKLNVTDSFPESLRTIDSYAFYNCDSITKVTIPEAVTGIGEDAFYGCDGLEELTLPDAAIALGKYAFGSCSGLRTVTIPVDYDFATDPFEDTRGVKTIHYTYGQTGVMLNRDGHSVNYHYIDYQYTLEHHSRNTLETMDFAEGITHIGNKLFDAGSSSLKTVQLPSTLQTIGSHAFYNCSALTGINLGDALTTIGSYAFYNCTSLTSTVSFSEGLQTIGSYAFAGCQKLNVTDSFPESLRTIDSYAFYNCDSITKVTIPEAVTGIGEDAFYGCDGLEELTLPDAAIALGKYAFGSCSGLRTVTIPVDYDFATDPFKDTRGVKTIHYTYGQTGVMLNRDGHSVNYHYIDYQYTLEHHSRGALETMDFAEGITHIGNKLFDAGSSSLKTVHLPSTLQTIGSHAFYNCSALTGINLGDALTTIGSYAFYNCTSLTSTVSFSEGLQTIGSYAFAGCQKLNVTDSFPESLRTIDSYAFYNCDSITKVTIPEAVTGIGEDAFYGCDGLEELTLPDAAIALGKYAFGSCSGLRTVTIPVDYDFATDPFKDTRGVKTIHYTYGQTGVMLNRDGHSVNYHYIDYQYTLEYHSRGALETMNFAEGITHIGNSLFGAGSVSLKTVQLPSTLQTVGYYAFYNCTALAKVIYCGTQEQWGAVGKGSNNDSLIKAPMQYHDMENGVCSLCGYTDLVLGDTDGDKTVDHNDAIYLLLHFMFGEESYPLSGAAADFDGNGTVNQDDAIYLLLHAMFGESFYPLKA